LLFNSVEFALFFAIVVAAYWWSLPRFRNPILLGASYFFYANWDWRFLGLLLISTVVDFSIGQRLRTAQDPGRRKLLLTTSMAVNLGILGLFKYANFFIDSFAELVGGLGLNPNEPFLTVVLPVGISFYTFQTMSYTIDVYRRRLEPVDDIVVFATFVAYFPQLVAGPIERARILLPQLQRQDRSINSETVASGLGLILVGLFKKVVLADGVAAAADRAFDDPHSLSFLSVAVGVLAFGIQIYGDFSGYTDIARGVSRLMGIELTLNFAQPYLSRNITEFWRRWHISLSNWLRDYLYIPLGGNRHGTARTYVNLMATMLLGGLWHGASWNFVVWGGLHGLFLVVHRLVFGGKVSDESVSWRHMPSILLTFTSVSLVWIFFRAADFKSSRDVFTALFFQAGDFATQDALVVLVAFATMIALDLAVRAQLLSPAFIKRQPASSGVLVALALAGILVFSGGSPRPFVYFQF
jgi:alginate O-acetyltransferase complex protein AlgI